LTDDLYITSVTITIRLIILWLKPNRLKARINLDDDGVEYYADVELFESPKELKNAFDELSIQVLRQASEGPVYTREIAKRMGVREQSVYYHVRRLVSLGLLKVDSTISVRGAMAKRVVTTSQGVAYVYDKKKMKPTGRTSKPVELARFFQGIVVDDQLKGYIVVGSPEPHGPFRASARDGHYATQLALCIGSFASAGNDFAVKLDTDAKLEMAYTNSSMILIGGPATNQITADLNQYLPVKFDPSNYWAGLVDAQGRRFSSDTDGVIARTPSPFAQGKYIILIAGIRHVGTKAAVIALTQQYKEILSDFHGQDSFACVIRGFDQDGDGKVDRADLVSTYAN
jgi:hypothetical protein